MNKTYLNSVFKELAFYLDHILLYSWVPNHSHAFYSYFYGYNGANSQYLKTLKVFFFPFRESLETFASVNQNYLSTFICVWEILTGELSSWIQMSFKHYAMQEAKQQFVEYDKNSDNSVSWDEYNIQMYDRVIDFDENAALDDAEEESFRQVSSCAQAVPFDHISSLFLPA